MLRRITTFALAGALLLTTRAGADDRPDFARQAEPVMAGIRSAASYVRTGNVALAQTELDDAMRAWKRLQADFADSMPPGYSATHFRSFLASGGNRLAAAAKAADEDDAARTASELQALRQSLYDLRHASGQFDLADCVFELAPAMEALRMAASHFTDAKDATPTDTIGSAAVFRDRLQRCNGWAPESISTEPEFRRLIDGAIASSSEIGRAAQAGDAALVHRYLIELQSFERLLAFRFG